MNILVLLLILYIAIRGFDAVFGPDPKCPKPKNDGITINLGDSSKSETKGEVIIVRQVKAE